MGQRITNGEVFALMRSGRMGSKRTVQIAELPDSGSVRDMHNLTYKILDQYPDAMISYEYDYEPTARYVVIQVDKTALDLQKEELEEKLNSLPYSYSINEFPSRVVVISQNTPIPEDVLEAIKADGKNDKYWLHLNGCVLERYLTKAEEDERTSQSKETREKQLALREILEKELINLRKLQVEQDKKYLM